MVSQKASSPGDKVFITAKPEIIQLGNKKEIEIRCHLPEENPVDAIYSISSALEYMGVFDGIKESAN